MKNEILRIPISFPFNFHSVLNSHGWVDLLPNTYNPVIPSFSRVEELPSGKVIFMTVSVETAGVDQEVIITVIASHKLDSRDKEYLTARVSHMLRLDEDFSGFYDLCEKKGGSWGGVSQGIGRLLRSPNLFEDLVKVICTTNIQWGGTKRMIRELVDAFGRPMDGSPEQKTFPSHAAIASIPFNEFQQQVRLGYRAEYIHLLARQFAEGSLLPSDLQTEDIPTEVVRKKLLAIKGIGSYAAASTLMLLGRYDHIPVDTVFRQFMSQKYFKGNPFDLSEAISLYDDWGKWKYLAYWFEMISFDNADQS